ncbi:LysR family transcriptional regulator [Pedobacter sp. MC2016-24]|uniref:LysR family transcriptional regulator n=1 Tax=Pedobacter sp. MC2016-24 TaxID=2780090 RepID=UPI00187F3403|nr:LysR family transcriptional regulator [Pedobacter sp. MC2016-24]MBE9598150.1 LysR family transcriptional regulator [Pedobacter sp. MC2016-24]
MELRHLLYFKTVAEELHFRKAALKLFISQPPLSRQIRELEEELGARLFERNNKQVSMTPAGHYFKKRVDAIFSILTESKQMVKELHDNLSGELRIGYISSTYHPHLMDTLQEMRNVFPFLTVKLFEIPTIKQVKALEDGKLDIGIMRAPVHSEKLEVLTLFHDPFIVVFPENTPAVKYQSNLGKYLSSQPFIFFNRDYAPVYYEKLIEVCQRLGFIPEITHEANNVHSILRLVAHGAGVSILPRTVRDHFPNLSLKYLELPGLSETTEVVLAHKPHQNEAITWFSSRFSAYFKA